MVAAIAIMIIVGFIIVAVMVNGFSSRDTSRATLDRASTEEVAREAGAVLASIYSSVEAGEFDKFVPSEQVLSKHAASTDSTLESNPEVIGSVDVSIPADRQKSVCRSLGDALTGCWQLFAVKTPDWGTTKAGAVTVYIRSWTKSTGGTDRIGDPMMYRFDLRPTLLSDYQMVADGKIAFGTGAVINGRVHSNGRLSSFFNQFSNMPSQINVGYGGLATCTAQARISTSKGVINTTTSPSCASSKYENTGQDVNLLRVSALVSRLKKIADGLPHPNLSLVTVDDPTSAVDVQLSGTSINVSGAGSADAAVTSNNNGAVVLVGGDINVAGSLGANARATIIAMSPDDDDQYSDGGAPSITITSTGGFGSQYAEPTSALGLIAQGDIIVPSKPDTGCGIEATGAFVAVSGMVSIDRNNRLPYPNHEGDDTLCKESAKFNGSIAGHYPPVLYSSVNNAGFTSRTYSYNPSLFNNPPPMFPTAFDWQVTKFAPADLSCFSDGGVLNTSADSGCVA